MKKKCCENVEINFTNYINVYYTSILHKSRMNRDNLANLKKAFNRTHIEEKICEIFISNEGVDRLSELLNNLIVQGSGTMYDMEGGSNDDIVIIVIKAIIDIGDNKLNEFKKAFVKDAIKRGKASLKNYTHEDYSKIIRRVVNEANERGAGGESVESLMAREANENEFAEFVEANSEANENEFAEFVEANS
jgi:hypothetical protein